MKLGIALVIISFSWSAQAGTGTDDPRVRQHIESMNVFADMNNMARPVVEEYQYGKALDIKDVIELTEEVKSCKLVPMAMTYLDGADAMRTVIFKNFGLCSK